MFLLAAGQAGFSQSFVNLDFENATFVSDPSSSYYPSQVYASNAIPGWTAYVAGTPLTDVFSNNAYLTGGCVTLVGTNWGFAPMQGQYFVALFGNHYWIYTNTAGIGQTGQIPLTAQSLIFWGNVGLGDVSFNGQTLSLAVIGSTNSYNIYGANISAFAGQTGQLLFTTGIGANDMIDNIQFSSTPVPEPGALGLFALGGVLLGLRSWKTPSREIE